MNCHEKTLLKKIATFKNGKKRPDSIGNIPVYGGNGILGYCGNSNNRNCVVVGRVGAYCGSVYYESGECWISDNAIAAISHEGHDVRFLYYLLKSLNLNQYSIGSSQPLITQKILNDIEIFQFSLRKEKEIISVLACIDDLISVNNKINDNLEQQIKMLIRAWFVEYLPFGGKIPNDWHSIPLSKIADFISGYSYKGNELKQSRTAMLTIKNFERNGGFKLNGFKELIPSSKIKPDHYVELFDTVVAHTDLTQKAEVIGNAELVLNFAGYDSVVFSMDLVKVIPKKEEVSKFMIAALLQNSHFKAHCLGYVNGTTVLHLSKRALPEYQLLFPDDLAVLAPLDKALRSMYMRMAFLIEENQKLQNIRDTLLPRLMSGEIDVSNIDL